MCVKKQTVFLTFLLVCPNIGLSQSNVKNETQPHGVENIKTNENQTSYNPSVVESRFFDLGGVINQLFPGFNHGNPGLNLPSNSQFYPGIPAQNWNSQMPINQGNGWYPNQQNIGRPLYQNQGLPSDNNSNQQGSINNINQPEQYLNQGGLGQYPTNLNGNLINGGGNQRGQGGNFQNLDYQQGQPSQLGGQQRPDSPKYNPNGFENQSVYPVYPSQGASNFNNNSPSNGLSNFNNNNPQNQIPHSNLNGNLMNQNSNGQFFNQNPGQVSYSNGKDQRNSIYNPGSQLVNQPNNQNGFELNQSPQYSNNQAQFFNQRPNQNNINQQNLYPSGQYLGDSFNNPANQGNPINSNSKMGQNNDNRPQGNINNVSQNVNQQDENLNNKGKPNQQFPDSGQIDTGSNDAIRFPDDDEDSGNIFGQKTSIPVTTVTTTPVTILPADRNAIIGKPIMIPTTTVPSNQVTLMNSDVTTASQKECVQNCPTSSEYNPVCGTDNVSYFNPGRLICARNCGTTVYEARRGNCNNNN